MLLLISAVNNIDEYLLQHNLESDNIVFKKSE